jgi:uncharacterized protein YecT (DUF1311 family)
MKNTIKILLAAASVALLSACGESSGGGKGGFSKSDCDMKLATSVWYAAFDKGTYSPAERIIGLTIAANKLTGYELDEKELRGQSNTVLEVGAGKFKEKSIPACLEKVDLNFTNRSQGERKKDCFAAAYTSDKEFGMFRDIKIMKCEDIDIEMPKWVKEKNITGMKYKSSEPAPEAAPAPAPAAVPETAPAPAPAPAAVPETAPAPAPAPVAAVDNSPFTPSFDCAKASNGQEKMICADRDLAKLDVQAAQAYAKARERSADKDKLKTEQLNWIKSNLRACSDKACLTEAYKKRISELQ